jgi:hypothetical protein
VLVAFAPRAKQRRWTVLLRLFMAIPLAVVLFFIEIATFVVVVIGWFGALFIGRTPSFTRDLVTITLRLQLRLSTYVNLLSDRFPGFSLEAKPEDHAHLAVPEATRMNRAAVFFRLILAIPVSILSSVVQAGLVVILFFMWFVVLITGWLPQPVFDAGRAALRFQTRFSAYYSLLVPTYPGGLFGDGKTAASSTLESQSELESESAPSSGSPWDLIVGKGGRRVLIVAIVLGTGVYIARIAGQVGVKSTFQQQQNLVNASNGIVQDINRFESQGKACQSEVAAVACLEHNDHTLAQQLTSFSSTLSGNESAGINVSTITTARTDALHLATLFFHAASAGPTRADYQSAVNDVQLDVAATHVQNSINSLQTALNNAP